MNGAAVSLSEDSMQPTTRQDDAREAVAPSAGTPGSDDPAKARSDEPTDTVQSKRDAAEKAQHSRSENELQSSQDKNPLPADATRRG